MKAKYIITESENSIVFSSALSHNQFKLLNPVSAGFVEFGTYKNGEIFVLVQVNLSL